MVVVLLEIAVHVVYEKMRMRQQLVGDKEHRSMLWQVKLDLDVTMVHWTVFSNLFVRQMVRQ